MSLPPLLVAGNLVSPSGDPAEQADLDKIVPVDHIIDWVRRHKSSPGIENRVLFVKSETGSGKSIAIPPALFRAFVYGTRAPGIICTQPRVITAVENVRDILRWNAELFREPGSIGWSTKHNKIRPTRYSLLSATIGTLLAQLVNFDDETFAARYGIVMVDEAHVRSMENDIALSYLKAFLRRNNRNQECPVVILMSATIDFAPYAEYFGVPLATNYVWCRGESKGFDVHFPPHPVPNFIETAVETVKKIIHEGADDPADAGDVLLFLPGNREIKETSKVLQKISGKMVEAGSEHAFAVLTLNRPIVVAAGEEYRNIVYYTASEIKLSGDHKAIPAKRKVILSTVVAETGITLQGLKYVIDCGFSREIQYVPMHGLACLVTVPESKDGAIQRRGRVGRLFRGVFYPLYPEYIFDTLREQSYPAVITDDVTQILLRIFRLQVDNQVRNGSADPRVDLAAIDLPTMPTVDAMNRAILVLYELGFVSPVGVNPVTVPEYVNDPRQGPRGTQFGMTRLGLLAQNLDLDDLMSTRMILAGFAWNVRVADLATIAACVATGFGPRPKAKPGARSGCDIWREIYTSALPKIAADHRTKLMVCDEFIDAMLAFYAMKNAIHTRDSSTSQIGRPHAVRRARETDGSDPADHSLVSFCAHNEIDYASFIETAAKREEIIEACLVNRMNVFSGPKIEDVADHAALIEYVARVKNCIRDGFRMNELRRVDGIYYSRSGLPVVVPNVLSFGCKDIALSEFPRSVVCAKLEVTKVIAKDGTYVYEPTARMVSVLDGF